jgi:hypothetical protein
MLDSSVSRKWKPVEIVFWSGRRVWAANPLKDEDAAQTPRHDSFFSEQAADFPRVPDNFA